MYARHNWDITETCYPAIRLSMDERREQLDDQQLENYLAEIMPGVEPEDVEDFMRSLQRFGKQAAPLAQRALPGVIQGAAQGGMVAGPWGAVAGALVGGASSLAGGSRSGQTRAQSPTQAPQQVPLQTPSPVAAGPAFAAAPAGVATGNAATNISMNMEPIQQLMMLLSRPETMQALTALLMSGSGRSTVNVGAQPIPAAAFANAISEIAAEVADAANASMGENIAEYLIDSDGMPRGDIVNPVERARLLLGEISLLATEEFYLDEYEDENDEDEYEDWENEEDMSELDAIDSYEQALQGGR